MRPQNSANGENTSACAALQLPLRAPDAPPPWRFARFRLSSISPPLARAQSLRPGGNVRGALAQLKAGSPFNILVHAAPFLPRLSVASNHIICVMNGPGCLGHCRGDVGCCTCRAPFSEQKSSLPAFHDNNIISKLKNHIHQKLAARCGLRSHQMGCKFFHVLKWQVPPPK